MYGMHVTQKISLLWLVIIITTITFLTLKGGQTIVIIPTIIHFVILQVFIVVGDAIISVIFCDVLRLVVSNATIKHNCSNFYIPENVQKLRTNIKAHNRPVPRKLKYLQNVNEPQLTMVAQHPVVVWRP